MLFDKRKSVSLILSKMGKDGRTTETKVKPEEGEHNEYTELAENMIAAVKDGSVQSLAACLKSLHDIIAEADEIQDEKEME